MSIGGPHEVLPSHGNAPTPRPGTVQEWVSIIVTATDPHAAVRAVMDPAPSLRPWQILTAVAERGSCRLPQNP